MSTLKKKGGLPALTAAIVILAAAMLTVFPAHASQPSIQEGAILFYKWARIGSGAGGKQTGDATFEILVANQTTIVTRVTGTSTVTITIRYSNGLPIYIDRLEALIYLPPECISQSLQGNLNWTKQVETRTPAKVIDGTAQLQEFTVEAGTFQSLNLTLNLAGWMYGNLTLIYDLNSGVLIYEQWIPEYGDIIIQSLSAVTQTAKPQNMAVSSVLTAITFATPMSITIIETHKAFKKGKPPRDTEKKRVFPKKPFYLILSGSTLNLASTLLPWSQIAKKQMYLPLSLPSTLTATTLIPITVSLTAHAAAITAWIGIALSLYTNRKLTSQLTILISGILSFTSVAIFLQSGWTPYWGVPIIAVSGILTILGLTATNIKIEIVTEKSEDKSTP